MFAHNYDVAVVRDLPSGSAKSGHYFFPGPTEAGGQDGLLVRVTPSSRQSWHGTFAFGNASAVGLTGVYSLPDPDSLLVVSAGRGVHVRADTPEDWYEVPSFPIVAVMQLLQARLVVVADYTHVTCLSSEGIRWKSARVSWDGIMLGWVVGRSLHGSGWDPTGRGQVPFVVDLENGEHQGGAAPD